MSIPKPAWALTAKETEAKGRDDEEREVNSLLHFARGLNFDKYIEDTEIQVRGLRPFALLPMTLKYFMLLWFHSVNHSLSHRRHLYPPVKMKNSSSSPIHSGQCSHLNLIFIFALHHHTITTTTTSHHSPTILSQSMIEQVKRRISELESDAMGLERSGSLIQQSLQQSSSSHHEYGGKNENTAVNPMVRLSHDNIAHHDAIEGHLTEQSNEDTYDTQSIAQSLLSKAGESTRLVIHLSYEAVPAYCYCNFDPRKPLRSFQLNSLPPFIGSHRGANAKEVTT